MPPKSGVVKRIEKASELIRSTPLLSTEITLPPENWFKLPYPIVTQVTYQFGKDEMAITVWSFSQGGILKTVARLVTHTAQFPD